MDAKVSAFMEAAEAFHGEHLESRFRRASARTLRQDSGDVVGPEALWRSPAHYTETHEIDWIEAVDLVSHQQFWIPAGSVHTELSRNEPVLVGSNGLATGNHLLEALVAALCEVIERDAVALWHARTLPRRANCRLDANSVDDPSCCAVLERFAQAKFRPRIWDVTSDVGVATFICDLPPRANDHAPTLRRSRGAGCHPEPAIALLRALTEAAQSRLHRIAGLRNDLTEDAYREAPAATAGAVLLDALTDAAPGHSFAETPRYSSRDIGEDFRWLLRRLTAAGLDRVLAVDLTKPEFGLPAVRVIVPGLEWDDNHPHYQLGQRAQQAARA
jgi:YcaO-like protein with predicted kinase domain